MKLDRKSRDIAMDRLIKADNLPYVLLGVLAAMSLISRVYLLTR